MAKLGLRIFLLALINLGIGFTQLYSANRPLELDRFKAEDMQSYETKVLNMVVPGNLSTDDSPVYVILKFVGHNVLNIRDKGFFDLYEKPSEKVTASSFEYTNRRQGVFRLREDLDLEFRFNADWPKRKLKMSCDNTYLKTEMAYIIGSNQFVLSISSKDFFGGVDLSLMNTKELSNSNNLLSVNLSFKL